MTRQEVIEKLKEFTSAGAIKIKIDPLGSVLTTKILQGSEAMELFESAIRYLEGDIDVEEETRMRTYEAFLRGDKKIRNQIKDIISREFKFDSYEDMVKWSGDKGLDDLPISIVIETNLIKVIASDNYMRKRFDPNGGKNLVCMNVGIRAIPIELTWD